MPRLVRRFALVALALSLVLVVGGCDAGGERPSPSPPVASGSPLPPPMQPTPDILAAQADLDGQLVGATGFFTTDGVRHLVCDAILESYPPQCGGAVIVVNGTIPPPVLAALESTKGEPGLPKVSWGEVEIRGVLHAAPAGARPSLDLVEMRVVTISNEGG